MRTSYWIWERVCFWYHHYVRPRNICSSVCRLTDIFQESNIDVWRKKVATKKNIKDEPTQMDGSSTLCTAKNCALNEASVAFSNVGVRGKTSTSNRLFSEIKMFFFGACEILFLLQKSFFHHRRLVLLRRCERVGENRISRQRDIILLTIAAAAAAAAAEDDDWIQLNC